MEEPQASRPHMPGYGLAPASAGLLPWSWAEERLRASRNFWISTVRPDGRPHAMAVWAAWHDGLLGFSSGEQSRKAQNLVANPACTATTESADEAVIIEGTVTRDFDPRQHAGVAEAYREKYGMGIDAVPGSYVFILRPRVVFGIIEAEEQFSSAATRWTFGG
ncbi:MAG: pyridoxamine 5'-phosphate oxidase family protein [Hyphomicrobiales bacterium]